MKKSLLPLLLLAGCSPLPDVIQVGHPSPGGDSSAEKSLKLSVESINGDEKERPFQRRVHVLHAESGKNIDELHAQAVRVACVDRVQVLVGGIHADEAAAIGDAGQADSILTFSGAGYPGSKPNTFLFCLGVSPPRQAKALVGFAKEKGKRFLLVTGKQTPDAFPQAFRSEIKAGLKELRLSEDPNFDTLLHLEVSRVDVLILCLSSAERGKVVSESLLSKLPPGGVVLAGEEVENLTNPAPNDFALTSYPDDEVSKLGFASAYSNAFKSPPDLSALMMHDAFSLAIQLFKRTESIKTAKMKEELLKKDARFDTLTGPIQFLPDGTCSRPLWLVQYREGGWKTVKKID